MRVAVAASLIEAEMMRDLLGGEEIPVLIRRPGGLDLPHLLVAGPREVMVRESDAERARALVQTHFRGVDDEDAGASLGGQPP